VHQWNLLRGLVRAGLCPRPRDPRYTQLMIVAVTPMPTIPEPSLRDRLLNDPELLDDEVWEIFDVELPLGLRGIFSTDPYGPANGRWDVVLAELAALAWIPIAGNTTNISTAWSSNSSRNLWLTSNWACYSPPRVINTPSTRFSDV